MIQQPPQPGQHGQGKCPLHPAGSAGPVPQHSTAISAAQRRWNLNAAQVQRSSPRYPPSRAAPTRQSSARAVIRGPSHLRSCAPRDGHQSTHHRLEHGFVTKGAGAPVRADKSSRSTKMLKAKLEASFPSELWESLPSPLGSSPSSTLETALYRCTDGEY